MDDLLIIGGQVIDGTGGPPRMADIAVTDGRITAIGDSGGRTARRVIYATGQVVAGWCPHP